MASQIQEDENVPEFGPVKPEPKLDDSWYFQWISSRPITKMTLILLFSAFLYGLYWGATWLIKLF